MEHIHFDNGEIVADLDVRPATVKIECAREALQGKIWASVFLDDKGIKLPEDQVNLDRDEYFVHSAVYPSLVACTEGTVTRNGEQLTWKDYEVFLELPGPLYREWYTKAQKVNSHWFFTLAPDEQEKKASS